MVDYYGETTENLDLEKEYLATFATRVHDTAVMHHVVYLNKTVNSHRHAVLQRIFPQRFLVL
jgi:hypothetical protein